LWHFFLPLRHQGTKLHEEIIIILFIKLLISSKTASTTFKIVNRTTRYSYTDSIKIRRYKRKDID
jgi:hypothetical protein